MLHDIITAFEANVVYLFIGHALISLLIAIVSPKYLADRFSGTTKEAVEDDIKRTELIQDESWIFRQLYKVSLHKNNNKMHMLFAFFFSFTIPLIGIFASLWLMWYLKNITYEKKAARTGILDLGEFEFTFDKVERIFGESSMIDMMNNPWVPKSKKVMALSGLASAMTPVRLNIIKETLKSSDDEIRMYGYAVINKAEDSIGKKLNKQLDIYNEAEDDKEKAFAAKELSFLYWEMVYSEIAHDSLKENFISESVRYLHESQEYYIDSFKESVSIIEEYKRKSKNIQSTSKKEQKSKAIEDKNNKIKTLGYYKEKIKEYNENLEEQKMLLSKIFILKGRIFMWKENPDAAVFQFKEAYKYDKSSFIVPYLAESYFAAGNFKEVRKIMNKAEDLKYNARLFPIVQQWRVA